MLSNSIKFHTTVILATLNFTRIHIRISSTLHSHSFTHTFFIDILVLVSLSYHIQKRSFLFFIEKNVIFKLKQKQKQYYYFRILFFLLSLRIVSSSFIKLKPI